VERPSKEERKRLRHEAERSIRAEDFFSHVISPDATLEKAGPEQIVSEAAKVCVNLRHRALDLRTHAFLIPGGTDDLSLVVGYGTLDRDILYSAEHFECFVRDRSKIALGLPVITFRGKINQDQAIDFLYMTMIRVLGRLTHGVLINGANRMMGDDWLTWSLDYMNPDMFNVTRVYQVPPPNFHPLVARFPGLRIQKM
jgi:hypothetical protein